MATVRQASDTQCRHLSNEVRLVHIKVGGYGWPRSWKELQARGIWVGKGRVQKLMQLHGIRAKGKRRFKVTTDSKHDLLMLVRLELPPFRGHFPTERKSPTCQDLNHPTRKPFATKWSNWCAAAALQVHCPRSLAATPPVS